MCINTRKSLTWCFSPILHLSVVWVLTFFDDVTVTFQDWQNSNMLRLPKNRHSLALKPKQFQLAYLHLIYLRLLHAPHHSRENIQWNRCGRTHPRSLIMTATYIPLSRHSHLFIQSRTCISSSRVFD